MENNLVRHTRALYMYETSDYIKQELGFVSELLLELWILGSLRNIKVVFIDCSDIKDRFIKHLSALRR